MKGQSLLKDIEATGVNNIKMLVKSELLNL
jgi:hypothetical protein